MHATCNAPVCCTPVSVHPLTLLFLCLPLSFDQKPFRIRSKQQGVIALRISWWGYWFVTPGDFSCSLAQSKEPRETQKKQGLFSPMNPWNCVSCFVLMRPRLYYRSFIFECLEKTLEVSQGGLEASLLRPLSGSFQASLSYWGLRTTPSLQKLFLSRCTSALWRVFQVGLREASPGPSLYCQSPAASLRGLGLCPETLPEGELGLDASPWALCQNQ